MDNVTGPIADQALFAKNNAEITQRSAFESRHQSDTRGALDALSIDWGDEKTANIDLLQSHFNSLPANERAELLGKTAADGSLLANQPKYLKELLETARAAPDELTKAAKEADMPARTYIEKKLIADRESIYWRGPLAQRMQAHYRKLIQDDLDKGAK